MMPPALEQETDLPFFSCETFVVCLNKFFYPSYSEPLMESVIKWDFIST